jgi:beta-lactamase regulating signal transducer with metallopeptidase domain
VETLVAIGLWNALIAAGLAILVAAVASLCRRPALVHTLWLLVLLKLITPPLVNVPILHWESTPLPTSKSPTLVTVARATEIAQPLLPDDDPGMIDLAQNEEPAAAVAADTPLIAQPAEEAHADAPAPVVAWNVPWQWAVGVSWLGGSCLWWLLACYRLVRFHRAVTAARPVSVELRDRVADLARRLGLARCPDVRFIAAPLPPLLWAIGTTPRLLLPIALWDHLGRAQQESLLVHELAHLRRRDHWVRRFELLVVGLYWWHPVVWWARREIQETEEQCCDAWAVEVSAGPTYAQALIETVAFLSKPRHALPMGASGMGQVRSLKRRLTMIVQGTTPKSLSWVGWAGIVALALLLLPLMPSWAQTEPQTNAPPGSPPAPELTPAAAAEPQPVLPPPTAPRAGRVLGLSNVRGPTEQIQAAQDDLELQQIQLEGKHAELQEARALLQKARRQFDRIKSLAAQKAVSAEVVEQAQSDVEVQEARLQVKEASLREGQLRVKQAERRLTQLTRRNTDPMSPVPPVPFGGGPAPVTTSPAPNKTPPMAPGYPAPARFGPAGAAPAFPQAPAAARTVPPGPAPTGGVRSVPGAPNVPDPALPPGADLGGALPRAGDMKPGMGMPGMPGMPGGMGGMRQARPADPEARMKDVERKLDALIQELDALRRELKRTKTGAAPPSPALETIGAVPAVPPAIGLPAEPALPAATPAVGR